MKNFVNQEERGAVSLITVMFMAVLLTIVTTSFISITINEQRQATDDDLTKRAFFAAESGVEDAKVALDQYFNGDITEAQLNGDDCTEATGSQPVIEDVGGIEASYTCQLISFVAPSFESELTAWESRSIPLNAVDPAGNPTTFSTVNLNWHDPGAGDSDPYEVRGSTDINLPEQPDWGTLAGDFPALMRVQITGYPTGAATFDASDAVNYAVFINPSNGTGDSPVVSITGDDGSIVTRDACTGGLTGGYACSTELVGFDDSNYNYTLRVSALYNQSNIQVLLDDGDDFLDGAQAILDVTAKAGDVYRRVQTRVGLDEADLLPDAAITSGKSLCKIFNITDVDTDFSSINSSLPDPSVDPLVTPHRLCSI